MPTTSHIARNVCVELADALSQHSWTDAIPVIAAVFRRTPDYTVEDLGTIKVSVVPGPVEVNQDQSQPRGADFFGVACGIVVAKHVSSDQDIVDLEDLNMAIVDAIRSYKITLANVSYTDWTDISIPLAFDAEALNERNVFLSQIQVTFLVPMDKLP